LNEWGDKWGDKTGRENVATDWQCKNGKQLAGQDSQPIGGARVAIDRLGRTCDLLARIIMTTNWLEKSRDQSSGWVSVAIT